MSLILPGKSDARFFSCLGIQTYGFTPMKLPPDIGLMQSAHGADERIPVEAVDLGANAVYGLLRRYKG
jgi:acetylornithine deacetylase/succinyl-diaminopimelate desuccinylase-like protein